MASYGQQSILQLGVETTYGTPATPTKQIRFASESLKLDLGKKSEGVLTGARMAARTWTMGRKITGNLTGQLVRPDEVGYWLAPCMGTEAAPTLVVGSTLSYKHAFTYSDTALPSMTLIMDRVVAIYEYTGVMVDTLSFSGASGDWIKMDVGVIGYDEQVGTLTPALTPSALRGFKLSDVSTVTIGATTMECTSVKIDLGNTFEYPQTTASGLHISQPKQTVRTLKMTLETIYEATTETVRSATWLADAPAAVSIVMIGDQIEAGHNYQLTFTVPAMEVTDLSPVVAGPGLMKASITLEAFDSSSPIEVDLINSTNAVS
jgi:hypothetical protein